MQAFGFCEYNNPDAGLRAIRILNGFEIADKKLVVKVDAKTRKILDDYLTERIKKTNSTTNAAAAPAATTVTPATGATTTAPPPAAIKKEGEEKKKEDEEEEDDEVVEVKQEKVDLETYTDEDMKYEDNLAKDRIGQILQDNQKEMQAYVPKVPYLHTVYIFCRD